MPFTNNLAEQAVRMPKTNLKISGCFRTVDGAVAFCTPWFSFFRGKLRCPPWGNCTSDEWLRYNLPLTRTAVEIVITFLTHYLLPLFLF
ncbi:hypothetical protein [Acidithiobacillus ferriphilus]|uniref:hypothetical protein n=1 Tax=Acidithiobacillus ferriphilus TaxID=1689834 RepID=UPI0038CC0825